MLAAADQLQIGMMQASRHPAVNRALELIGVPVSRRRAASAGIAGPRRPSETRSWRPRPLPATATDQPDPAAADTDDRLQFSAIHVDGVIDLPASKPIELRLSQDGLDIIRGDGAVFGGWLGGDRRAVRRSGPDAADAAIGRTLLVLRTGEGEAIFEVPDLSPSELSERVGPLLTAHARRVRTRPGDAP